MSRIAFNKRALLSVVLREPFQPLSETVHNVPPPLRTIRFRHPGYPNSSNILLVLYAFDSPDGGLHYGTAFLACAIVAVNAFNGYMTETLDGDKLEMDWDKLLIKEDYYFHVPPAGDNSREGQYCADQSATSSNRYQYPVYPSFNEWSFPHATLPKEWPRPSTPPSQALSSMDLAPPSVSGLTAHVLRRDNCCIVTSSRDCIERAHLCPRNEDNWFKRNSMGQYNIKRSLGKLLLDDVSNAIALRSDLHTIFDQRKFLISRKKSQWAVHFLETTNELGGLYHNSSLQIAGSISPFFLFVRFAWAIFPFLREFLDAGVPRRLRLRVKDNPDLLLEETKVVGFEELGKMVNEPKSRTSSPSKRQRPSNDDGDDVRNDNSCFDGKKGCEKSPEDISEPRGRKRHRTSSVEPTRPAKSREPATTTLGTSSPLPSLDPEMDLMAIEKVKLQWLRAQRPSEPQVICCDYNEAERADRLGLPGPRKYGGAHLCLECLGAEYKEELPPLPDRWQDEYEESVT
ncbi:hypothetical protein ACLMJK_003816 [Lecanora helva]